jgi:hypothetical protein
MTTISEAISRVRNTLKAVKEDPFLTDRTIYFSILKYGKSLMKREDNKNRLMKIPSLFTTLTYVELIDVDTIEAQCVGVYSGCTIKRTKEKLPEFMTGAKGPLIRSVTSIDSSIELQETKPSIFTSISKSTNYKYNKTMYYWYLGEYLYMPNVPWDAIKIDAAFEGDTSAFACGPDAEEKVCIPHQDNAMGIPDYLFSEIEQYVIKELTTTIQIPTNGADDSQNVLR